MANDNTAEICRVRRLLGRAALTLHTRAALGTLRYITLSFYQMTVTISGLSPHSYRNIENKYSSL